MLTNLLSESLFTNKDFNLLFLPSDSINKLKIIRKTNVIDNIVLNCKNIREVILHEAFDTYQLSNLIFSQSNLKGFSFDNIKTNQLNTISTVISLRKITLRSEVLEKDNIFAEIVNSLPNLE